MTITTFKNMKGLIHGKDPKRISCHTEGVLKIANTSLDVTAGESILPALINGGTGEYDATFTDSTGQVYDLGKVKIMGGRILPPPPTDVEIMELRCRADTAEDERDALREKVTELEHIFDTDALNFLIK